MLSLTLMGYTSLMAHNSTAEFDTNIERAEKRRKMSRLDRKRCYEAHLSDDWATLAELYGEDIGTN